MSMTNQEIFDQVVTHLLTQKTRAVDSYGDCQYKAYDKETGEVTGMCAVGCLIPDKLYSEDLEGEGLERDNLVSEVVSRVIGIDLDEPYGTPTYELLKDLQSIHDDSLEENWHNNLKQLAIDHSLTFNPPTT